MDTSVADQTVAKKGSFVLLNHQGQATSDIPERHRIDLQVLARYLASHLHEFATPDTVLSARKFKTGQSNPTYLLSTADGRRWVLRMQPIGKNIRGAHAVDREARVIGALSGVGFSVPKMYHLCTDSGVLGRMFYLMSFEEGMIYDNALSGARREERASLLFEMTRTLACLHQLDVDALGLSSFGKKVGFYDRQIRTMSRVSAAQMSSGKGKVAAIPRLEELLTWFRSNLPPDRCCLIHGDFKPDNVVFALPRGLHEGKKHVVAVLDWELSTLGHPLSDLANLCLAYYMPPGSFYPSFCKEKGRLMDGIPPQQELHRIYCTTSKTIFPIPQWHFFVAFALFRLAVIVQGVAMRVTKGVASASHAMSPETLQFALDLLSKLWWHVITEGEKSERRASPNSNL